MSLIHKGQIIASNYITGDTLPIGSQIPFGSLTIPDNWLLCDGRAISRADYSELFTVIGTSYGVGDGSTTFNLPNKKGRTSVGYDSSQTEFNTIGKTGGSKYLQEHDHKNKSNSFVTNTYPDVSQASYEVVSGDGYFDYDNFKETDVAGTGDSGNLPPYQTDVWIIKAKQSSGVVATVVDDLDSTSPTNALSANMGRVLKSLINELKPIEQNNNGWNQTVKIDGKKLYRRRYTDSIILSANAGGNPINPISMPTNLSDNYIRRMDVVNNSREVFFNWHISNLIQAHNTSSREVTVNYTIDLEIEEF